MKTIQTDVTVGQDGAAVIQLRLPSDVPAGRHPAVIVRDDRPSEAPGTRVESDLPVHDFGPWPEGLSLRWEDFYGDDGR